MTRCESIAGFARLAGGRRLTSFVEHPLVERLEGSNPGVDWHAFQSDRTSSNIVCQVDPEQNS
jgi:hypothetical protein